MKAENLMLFLPQIVTALLTITLLLVLRHFSEKFMLMDPISGHKQHSRETAVVGGIAMMMGILSIALSDPLTYFSYYIPLNLALVIMITGVIDDAKGLTSEIRLGSQILISCIVFYAAEIKFLGLGDILFNGSVNLGFFALPFTIIAICGSVNAINWMDGLDGLAGGLTLITLFFLGLLYSLSNSNGSPETLQLILIISASVLSFLLFNYRFTSNAKATIFMGDGGAYPLGFLIACLFIISSQGSNAVMTPSLALWIMAIPLLDMTRVIWSRIRRGVNLTDPGRDHIQHVLLDIGYSSRKAVIVIHFLALIIGGIGVFLYHSVSTSYLFLSFLLLWVSYFVIVNALTRKSTR